MGPLSALLSENLTYLLSHCQNDYWTHVIVIDGGLPGAGGLQVSDVSAHHLGF